MTKTKTTPARKLRAAPKRNPEDIAWQTLQRAAARGRDRSEHAARQHISTAAAIHKPGLYDGAELRDFEGRAGAMDAFRLPSVIQGRRVWRRGA